VFTDPDRVNLRKAARAAIVTPALFAVLILGFDAEVTGLFAAFGSFAAVVFSDFGGTMRGRARAYGGVLVAGCALVALGTVCSQNTVAAVAAMVVVGFVVVFLGCLGGYFAAGSVTVTLAFVLAVMVPGPLDQLGQRELGWLLGVGCAGIAAIVLWPVEARRKVRNASAVLCDALASVLESDTPDHRAEVARARAALDANTGAVFRPAGSALRDRAMVALCGELRLAEQFVAHISAIPSVEDRALDAAAAEVLRGCAAALRSPTTTLDVTPLVTARAHHTDALESWVDQAAYSDAAGVITRFDDEFPVRALSLRVLAIAADVATSSGAVLTGVDAADDRAPADLHFLTAPSAGLAFARRIADHWSLQSVRFRAAVRASLGLAIAVLIAKLFDLDHAFWVVLGTLSVLRSNAFGTGVTGIQAVAGTLLGFAVATAGVLVIGGDDTTLWIVLPIVTFLTAYTPGAVHFVVGQAFFTVFVVVLFNLIEPEGWRTGLVRVEDIAIGVGISFVIGVLLWPRGARAAAVESFRRMLGDGAALLTGAMHDLVGTAGGRDTADLRIRAVASRDRAVSALEDLAVERGGGQVDRDAWVALLGVSTTLVLAGNGIERLAAGGPAAGCTLACDELARAGEAVGVAVEQVAAGLGSRRGHLVEPVAHSFARPASDGLRACVAERVEGGGPMPIALLWTREFLTVVQDRVASLDGPPR